MPLQAFILSQLDSAPEVKHPGLDVAGGDIVYGTGNQLLEATFSGQRWLQHNRTANVAQGRAGVRYILIDPHLFLETRFPALPYILQAQDLVAATFSGVRVAEVFWGFGMWIDEVDRVASLDLIGFRATNTGNWRATVKDRNATYLDVDTGLVPTVIHELTIKLDGSTRTVAFLVDGAVMASYQFVAPTVLGNFDGAAEHPKFGSSVWQDAGAAATDGILYAAGASRPTITLLPSAQDSAAPGKPTLSVVGIGGTYVDLAGSTYSQPIGLAQKFSIWQIDEVGGDFSTPVKEILTSTAPLTSARIGGLTPLTTYIARVLYMDTAFTAGPFSDAVAFSTDAQSGVIPLGAPDCAAATFTEVTG